MEVSLLICGCPAGTEAQWGVGNQEFKEGGAALGAKLLRAVSMGLSQCFMKQYKRHLQPTPGLQ